MSMSGRTYSQRKRDKMDYRREYFRKNPGIFGCIWTCAYCHRPLIGKQNVQVDHIIPLNNILGRNAGYNLVAACPKCNNRKSDRVDGRVVQGYISKLFEAVIFTIQKVIIVAVVAVWIVIQKVFSFLGWILSAPFRDTSIVTKLIAVCCYVAVGCFVYLHFRI